MQVSSFQPIPPWLLWLWGLLTLASLGLAPLFDYDETVYAQTAIDMMHQGEWVVPTANGMQFFEKPPFTYYMMDLCFQLFGENAFAARLPSALFSMTTGLLLLYFGTLLHSKRFGLMAAAIFFSMLEVGFLAHAAVLDAVLNCFIAATLLNYAMWVHSGERRYALWAAAMMGVAVSIKGPVGAAVPVLVIVAERLLAGGLRRLLADIPWLMALPLFLLTATPWYLMILLEHGPGFLYEFIWIQNIGRAMNPMQGHGGGWHYYLVVFMVSVLPWLAAVPWAGRLAWQSRRNHDPLSLLARVALVLTVLVIVLFTFAQTKLPHYISSIYPGVALLLAVAWERHPPDNQSARRMVYVTLVLLLPVALLLVAAPWLFPLLKTLLHHPRTLAILAQDIAPTLSMAVIGLILTAALIWLWRCASRSKLLIGLVVTGMVLQFTLLIGVGGFVGRLMQAPTMAIAGVLKKAPADMPFYSYNLNAPSVSFYSGRNYKQLLGNTGAGRLRHMQPPYLLMLRSESRGKLSWLRTRQPLIEQGGFLLYTVNKEAGS